MNGELSLLKLDQLNVWNRLERRNLCFGPPPGFGAVDHEDRVLHAPCRL